MNIVDTLVKCTFSLLATVLIVQAINPNGPIVVDDYVNCLSDLIRRNFHKPGLLIFPHTVTSSSTVLKIRSNTLKRIHGSNKYTVQVTGPDSKAVCNDPMEKFKVVHTDPFKVTSIANHFVIIVDSFEEFVYLVRNIIRSWFWNPYGKFLILLYNFNKNDNETHEEVEVILNCLFKYNAINVVVMVPQIQNIRNLSIYSWHPYDPPDYCGHFNESAKNRSIIDNFCYRGIVKHKDIFKDKLPLNMQRCSINILAIEKQPFVSRYKYDPNVETKIVKPVLESLNFSINYDIILNKFRGERENGVWDGALEDLVAKKGQILLGGIFPDFDVHEDFECSSTYLEDSYAWVVPRAYPLPAWSSLTAAFETEVWYLVSLVFIVCVLTWKIFGQISGDTKYNATFIHCFINSWLILFGFPAYARPNKDNLRIFFIFLNMFCILFMTAYQTKLIIVLRNQSFGYQIKTIQDLVQSELRYGGSEELHGLFNSTHPFDSLINNKWIDVQNTTKALLDVVVYRNFSLLCSRLELSYLASMMPELSDSFGRNTYYAFDKSTFSVPLEMIALRGFPFMKHVSRTLNLLNQLGMNEYVIHDFAKLNKRNRDKTLHLMNVRQTNVGGLSIQHLQSGFFVLGLGMVGGFIVLIMEVLINSKYIREKKILWSHTNVLVFKK